MIQIDGKNIQPPKKTSILIALNKPVGYICSKDGQGGRTIYSLLPKELQSLNPIGRLDKDSSGLLLMTNDGQLMQEMAHPSFSKQKVYKIQIDKPLKFNHFIDISKKGVNIGDSRPSAFLLSNTKDKKLNFSESNTIWYASLEEGRNRQIRRTFEAIGYRVTKLHRIQFGTYKLDNLKPGEYSNIPPATKQ